MRALQKGPEPRSLTDHRQSHGNWNTAYGNVKSDVRTQIDIDQAGMCAYCEERTANRIGGTTDVDHVHPQSIPNCKDTNNHPSDSNWSLTWSNLVGTCDRHGQDGCNRRKSNADLCLELAHPYRLAASFSCTVSRSGKLTIVGGRDALSPTTEAWLNHNTLRDKRQQFWLTIEQAEDLDEARAAFRGSREFVSTLASLFGCGPGEFL